MDAKLEFDVDLDSTEQAERLKGVLKKFDGIKNFKVDVSSQVVIVESDLPSANVQEAVESIGNKAVLKGIGSSEGHEYALQTCAVAELTCGRPVLGVVRFVQMSPTSCIIDGTIDGLTPGPHGLHIHESGDLSNECNSIGDHYNPTNSCHGGPNSNERHVGDLGNISASDSGRASFRLLSNRVKVYEIIGRALAVTEKEDDMGVGEQPSSKVDGNSGKRLSCGVIARSAGLFQNPKKICECSGRTLWDERDEAKRGQSPSTS